LQTLMESVSHTWRSFASHLAMGGVPLKAIQELMGHSTIEMTIRYAHLSPDVKKDAVQVVDRRSHGNLTNGRTPRGRHRETSPEKSVPDGIRRLGVGCEKLNRDATLPRTHLE
jgi:hypothetical protein